MTIFLYRPVLIESAAQAEALPRGTQRLQDGREGLAVGWTALVPIEVEECHSEDYGSYHLMEAIDGPKPFIAYLVDQEEA